MRTELFGGRGVPIRGGLFVCIYVSGVSCSITYRSLVIVKAFGFLEVIRVITVDIIPIVGPVTAKYKADTKCGCWCALRL